MNIQTTMKTVNGQTIITHESIPDDKFVSETKYQYFARIGAKNNTPITMQECNRED